MQYPSSQQGEYPPLDLTNIPLTNSGDFWHAQRSQLSQEPLYLQVGTPLCGETFSLLETGETPTHSGEGKMSQALQLPVYVHRRRGNPLGLLTIYKFSQQRLRTLYVLAEQPSSSPDEGDEEEGSTREETYEVPLYPETWLDGLEDEPSSYDHYCLTCDQVDEPCRVGARLSPSHTPWGISALYLLGGCLLGIASMLLICVCFPMNCIAIGGVLIILELFALLAAFFSLYQSEEVNL